MNRRMSRDKADSEHLALVAIRMATGFTIGALFMVAVFGRDMTLIITLLTLIGVLVWVHHKEESV